MISLTESCQKFIELNKEKKIVFTNGCFDILHIGHVNLLNQAKKLGEILIVGLNSDSSVSGLKGSSRPINKEKDRKYILENLKSVDFVEIFSDETPYQLIKLIKPAVLVKGGDWPVDKIIGHDIVFSYGGEVKSLNLVNGYSTSSTIEKLQGKK